MKVRRGFVFAFIGVAQVGIIYHWIILTSMLGKWISPEYNDKFLSSFGEGFLVEFFTIAILVAIGAIGYALYKWGEFCFENSGKLTEKIEKEFYKINLRRQRKKASRPTWEV